MSKLNSCKGRHLNLEDRIFIEYALDEQYTLKEIAKRIEKDPTTISKEIKRNRVPSSKKNRAQFLRCINQKSCRKKQLCRETCTNLCQNERYQYRSKVAEANYKEILKSSREGLN